MAVHRSLLRTGAVVATVMATVAVPALPAHAAITSQPVIAGLGFPAAFTFAPDGRIFYGERFSGEIHTFDPSTSADSLFFTVPNVLTTGEQGLVGLALHPGYPSSPYVYAYATRDVSGSARNQILRITDSGGTGSGMKVIRSLAAGTHHNGGPIEFGPDGMLYVVVGERGNAANAQNLDNNLGKVLRMTPSGAAPADNPFAGKFIWAYGIRNSFGLGFDPLTGRMWETDNGPECNDELNRIRKAGNYGWGPSETCATPPDPPANTNQDGPNPILPQRWYTPTIAPTGLAFCSECGLGSLSEGRLFFGAWNTGQIRRVTLGPNRWSAVSQGVVYTHPSGILSIEVGPDGALYFSDSTSVRKLVLS